MSVVNLHNNCKTDGWEPVEYSTETKLNSSTSWQMSNKVIGMFFNELSITLNLTSLFYKKFLKIVMTALKKNKLFLILLSKQTQTHFWRQLN